MADATGWSFIAGETGATRVRAYDRGARGIFLEWWEQGPPRKRVRQACGHADRERAKAQAEALALAFWRHERAPRARVTLGALFASYLTEVTPGKEKTTRRHDQRCAEMFCRIFGPDRRPETLSRREWDRFVADRRAGRVAPKGVELGKPVGNRIIACDLLTLRAVLNWATMAGDGEGGMLLERNPLKGLPVPRNESPTRRVLTAAQYAALQLAATTVRNSRVLTFLTLAHETGHQSASIRQLRWSDVDLDRRTIHWRAENDKQKQAYTTPLTEAAAIALEVYQRHSQAIGDAWVFPDHRRGEGPLTRDGAGHLWKRLAKRAGLPEGERYGWHSCRRKFGQRAQADEPQGPLRARRVEGAADAADVLRRPRCRNTARGAREAAGAQFRIATDTRNGHHRRLRAGCTSPRLCANTKRGETLGSAGGLAILTYHR